MADYFSEYSSFIGAKGLPSPADTPYETPGFIRSERSKRSSRATAGSSRSREPSSSPPPLPPDAVDYAEKSRDGRYSALDPRRFTPTLHASLVSEILTLRRELDSKNNLVENLEGSLATSKHENDVLSQQLSSSTKEIRSAKQQVQQMERGTYDALEDLVKERDAIKSAADDLKNKLEAANRTTRRQDDDALQTQAIWQREKELWDNERRQLERRIHVTENRLRTFVDEVSAQQAAAEAESAQQDETGDEGTFKDSGLGNDSDAASVSSKNEKTHKRNVSSISYRSGSLRRTLRNSASNRTTTGTPEPHAKPNGYSLADELGIDEEDEYDIEEFEHADDELEYHERDRLNMVSRQGSVTGSMDLKAKRVLGLTDEAPGSPLKNGFPKDSTESQAVLLPTLQEAPKLRPKLEYVDAGYQPSPPPSPPRRATAHTQTDIPTVVEPSADVRTDGEDVEERIRQKRALEVATRVAASPISPPETPIIDGISWPEGKRMSIPPPAYSDMSTQTDAVEPERPKSLPRNRDSLQLPPLVPSIAIHPPTSRPSSPRPYMLPPGTKNAGTQASLPWSCRNAAVQTEEIRVDKRPVRLPKHLLPNYLLPSPNIPEPIQQKRGALGGTARIFTNLTKPFISAPPLPSPPMQSPTDSSPEMSRNNSTKDLRSMPLKAIPLPRPVLSPPMAPVEMADERPQGPLNRNSQYGVTQHNRRSKHLADVDIDSESEDEEAADDSEPKDLAGSIPALSRPSGRFGLSEPPKRIPEDQEASPERRPPTSGSYGAAPAPSIASSRANSQRARKAPPPKLNAYHGLRSRSPSFGSVASSSYSTQSALPPFPIPTRSSSRVVPHSHSEGSHSPTPGNSDPFGVARSNRNARNNHARQASLRKVQSAAAIRHNTRRASPPKQRRRRRSPDLTPVQSMAFDSPAPTKFPIPDLPTPLQKSLLDGHIGGSRDLGRPSTTTNGGLPTTEANLVDAIAATMVGEWMWKYIRKRKSFGVGEAEDDVPPAGADGKMNITGKGIRHKRWVWLSPYERTIMWDNKQPTSGTALLGKKGRKLAIQSVLDVQDDTPMPKGAGADDIHKRSILILTPARALKFTAATSERHALWMTALSFLAESTEMQAQLPALPVVPAVPSIPSIPQSSAPTKRPRSPSFGRAKIRDSVRLTQNRRPSMQKSSSHGDAITSSAAMAGDVCSQNDGADFPAIPRLYSSTNRHQRKRSNTSPRLPPPLSNLRSFSSSAVPSSAASNLHPASTASFRPNQMNTNTKNGSRRASTSSPDRPNFFEAVGTVRMEAFVDPSVRDGVLYLPAPPSPFKPAAPAPRRRRNDSNLSTSTADKRRAGYVFDENGIDPFKGF